MVDYDELLLSNFNQFFIFLLHWIFNNCKKVTCRPINFVLMLSHQLKSEAMSIRRITQRISIQFYYVMKWNETKWIYILRINNQNKKKKKTRLSKISNSEKFIADALNLRARYFRFPFANCYFLHVDSLTPNKILKQFMRKWYEETFLVPIHFLYLVMNLFDGLFLFLGLLLKLPSVDFKSFNKKLYIFAYNQQIKYS